MLCLTCSKRESCIELCVAAEEYVDKDHVKRVEPLASEHNIDINNIIIESIETIELLNVKDWVYLLKKTSNLTKKQKKYLYLYYWKGITQKEISERYSTCPSNVCGIITRAKCKIAKFCL